MTGPSRPPTPEEMAAELRRLANAAPTFAAAFSGGADMIDRLAELCDSMSEESESMAAEEWRAERREQRRRDRTESPEGRKRARFADFPDSLINEPPGQAY